MNGSIRQRSAGSWELRASVGVDPATGRRLDRSITVRGNRSDAERELAEMVARVRCVRAVGSRSTMSELFEAWFATAVDGWSPATVRQNRSVLDCHLHRHIGSVVVGDVTPALIDALYVRLRRGDNDTRPLAAATVARDELGVLAGDAMGVDFGTIRRHGHIGSSFPRTRCAHRHRPN
jgi:integrase